MKKNLEKFENVEIVKCALSDQCGTGTLSFPKWEKNKEREMNTGLLSLYGNSDINCENVEIKTLDTCFLKKDLSCNVFLKIDVEGNESKVLKGGENFLSQNLDMSVQIELNLNIDNAIKNNNIQNSINFLGDLKYKPFSFSNNQVKFLSEDELNKIVTNNVSCEVYFRKKAI